MGATATATTTGRRGEEFWTDFPFTKAAKGDGTLQVTGYASTWIMDRDEEYVDPRAFDESLATYMTNPIMLWQHNMDWPLGTMTQLTVDEHGLAVVGEIPKPQPGEDGWKFTAYNSVATGVVRTFSVGGYFYRDMEGGRRFIKTIDLFEISVVSVPANPDSIFEAALKNLKGGRRPVLAPKAIEQMAQLTGCRPMTDPELVQLDAEAREGRYGMLNGMYRRAGKQAPSLDAFAKAQALEDPVERAGALVLLAKRVYGYSDDVKAGRVLSSANEKRLRTAADQLEAAATEITTVLGQLPQATDGTGDGTGDGGTGPPAAGASATGEGKGTKPPNLRSGTPTSRCSGCKFFNPVPGNPDSPTGFCKKYEYTVKQGQTCDSFVAKGA